MKIVRSIAAIIAVIVLSVSGCSTTGSFTDRLKSGQSSAQEQREQKEAQLPRCSKSLGTVAIVEPDKNWWQQLRLESPEALIKMYVLKSGCFTIVDRGRGFEAAQREQALAAEGQLSGGSGTKGKVKAADFLILPDIVSSNENAGGSRIGAILGSFVPIPGFAAVAGGLSMSDKTAEVTLTVTNTRTLEQVLMAEGKAEKTDIGLFGAGSGLSAGSFGAAGAGSYGNTSIGQVVGAAYLDAYAKLVSQMGGVLVPEDTPAPNK